MKMTNSCYRFGLLSTVVVTTQSLNCNNLFTSQATITSKNIQNSIYFRCITQNLFQRQFQNWKNSMKFTNFYIQKKKQCTSGSCHRNPTTSNNCTMSNDSYLPYYKVNCPLDCSCVCFRRTFRIQCRNFSIILSTKWKSKFLSPMLHRNEMIKLSHVSEY